jgi:hypothetical protein
VGGWGGGIIRVAANTLPERDGAGARDLLAVLKILHGDLEAVATGAGVGKHLLRSEMSRNIKAEQRLDARMN